MTIDEALIQLRIGPGINEDVSEEYNEAVDIAIEALIQLREQMSSSEKPNKWIPLTKRPMTKEEREEYEERTGITETMILNCSLPEDGEEVLVSYGDYVCIDTFHDDDGCYFEGVEIDDVEAWMPLPLPWKAESEDKE